MIFVVGFDLRKNQAAGNVLLTGIGKIVARCQDVQHSCANVYSVERMQTGKGYL